MKRKGLIVLSSIAVLGLMWTVAIMAEDARPLAANEMADVYGAGFEYNTECMDGGLDCSNITGPGCYWYGSWPFRQCMGWIVSGNCNQQRLACDDYNPTVDCQYWDKTCGNVSYTIINCTVLGGSCVAGGSTESHSCGGSKDFCQNIPH
jgi:hypothetical protein